jgi:hypothetical protein
VVTLLVNSKTLRMATLHPTVEGQRDHHCCVKQDSPMLSEIQWPRLNQQSQWWHGLSSMTLKTLTRVGGTVLVCSPLVTGLQFKQGSLARQAAHFIVREPVKAAIEIIAFVQGCLDLR